MRTYPLGDTPVVTTLGDMVIHGTVVGKATTDLQCTDGQLPNSDYVYTVFVAPLSQIQLYDISD